MSRQMSVFAGRAQPVPISSRGRVYRCLKCFTNNYEGEKSKVELHIYKKHVALDQVPFFCNICKFVSTSQNDLEKHIIGNSYPTHKATVENMRLKGEAVNEPESLLMNSTYYRPVIDIDYTRLSKEESEKIFSSRSRKTPVCINMAPEIVNKTNDCVLRDVLLSKKVPEVCRSEASEHILPSILGYDFTKGTDDINIFPSDDHELFKCPKENKVDTVVTSVNPAERNVVVKDNLPKPSVSNVEVKDKSKESVDNNDLDVIKSDMKILGKVMEQFMHQIDRSVTSLVNVTNNIERALDRQTAAFNRLSTAMEGIDKDKENRRDTERQHNFQRNQFQRNRSRSRSPVRRSKFMKY